MADIPPDVVERIQRNWSTIPADVQDRLMRAGIGGSSTTTTKTTTPGWGTTAAEVAGGTLGGLAGTAIPGFGAVGGPIVGAGVGTAAGGALADYMAGRPNRLETAAVRGATGAASEGVGRAVAVPVNAAGRATARAVSQRFPGATRFIERLAPGAVGLENEATAITKPLGGEAMKPKKFGERGKAALQTAKDTWWGKQDPIFRGVEEMAGESPVVPTHYLQDAARGILDESKLPTAKGPIRAASRLASTGRKEATAAAESASSSLVDQFGNPIAGPAEAPDAVFRKALEGHAISFREARVLESQLGKMTRGAPTPETHQAREMLDAIQQGMDEFLNTEAGADVAPALAAAKAQYREGKRLFYETPVGKLIQKQPERLFATVFRPGNITNTDEFRGQVPPDVWKDAVASWADRIYQKSTRLGKFDPVAFAKHIDAYEKEGHLEHIVPPAQRQALVELRDRFFQMAPGETTHAQALGKMAAQALTIGGIGYEAVRRNPADDVANHPLAAGGLLGALSVLAPSGRAVYGRLLPQVGGQAVSEALRGRPY